MTLENSEISIKQLQEHDSIPYDLLLLADPSGVMIDRYIHRAKIFVATIRQQVTGTIVLYGLSHHMAEIKNIAVKEEFQGKGIGKLLLDFVIETARKDGYHRICIATANSSTSQLNLYQKKGFEIKEIVKNFFVENYTEPIFENGIQAKHKIVLERKL